MRTRAARRSAVAGGLGRRGGKRWSSGATPVEAVRERREALMVVGRALCVFPLPPEIERRSMAL